MTSIIAAYFDHGSKGFTEAGKRKGLQHLGCATAGLLLTITGIALFILIELYTTGTIPSKFCIIDPQCIALRYTLGLLVGLALGMVPISVAIIPGACLMNYNIYLLREKLSDEDRAKFIADPVRTFDDHDNI